MPDPAIAFQATGYERGTITPLGSTNAWPVYADELIVDPARREGAEIAMGSGETGYSLFVDPDALVAALDATVADITDPE
jgi:prolyl-tRNA editing enzyme YbaK/EbsC (Cys-tRNA(Pro) deacylase)